MGGDEVDDRFGIAAAGIGRGGTAEHRREGIGAALRFGAGELAGVGVIAPLGALVVPLGGELGVTEAVEDLLHLGAGHTDERASQVHDDGVGNLRPNVCQLGRHENAVADLVNRVESRQHSVPVTIQTPSATSEQNVPAETALVR